MVRMDALIRSKTNGTCSIDDVVQGLLDWTRAYQSDTIDDLINLMVKEIGPEARTEYQDMYNGKTLAMPGNSLGPCFAVEQVQIPQDKCTSTAASLCNNPTTSIMTYRWNRKPGVSDTVCLN